MRLPMPALLLIFAGLMVAGCARSPYPNWAPQNPSPEFSRAAELLKPPPAGDPAFDAGKPDFMPAAWELFGSLSEQQIGELQEKKQISLALPQMTEKQKSLLRAFLDKWPAAKPMGDDLHRDLVSAGAAADYANVETTFVLRSGNRVTMMLNVRQPNGLLSPPLPVGLGWLKR